MTTDFSFVVSHEADSVRKRLEEQIAPEGTRLDSDDRLGRYRHGHAAEGDAIEIVRYVHTGKYGSRRYAPRTFIVEIAKVPRGSRVSVRLKPLGGASNAGRFILFLLLCLPLGLLGVCYAASASDVRRNVVHALPILVTAWVAMAGLFATLPVVVTRANVNLERDFLRYWLGVPSAQPPRMEAQVRVIRDSLLYVVVYFTVAVFVAAFTSAILSPHR